MATEAAIARFGLPVEFSAEALREAQRYGKQCRCARGSASRGPARAAAGHDRRGGRQGLRRCGVRRAARRTAAFGCWSRSPTSATTCGPAARSTARRASAAPRCISRRACCRCCRRRCRITCARSSRMWTGCAWLPTCRSRARGALEDSRFYPAVMRSAARLTYTQAHEALFLGVPAARARLGDSLLDALLAAGGGLSRAARQRAGGAARSTSMRPRPTS